MTTWVERPEGGRDRGPRGLARAWVEVLVRPRRFFRNGVAPGDQAPGLTFAVAVAVAYVGGRFLFVPGARPDFFASEAASALVGLLVAALVVAPAALHLTAALLVVLLALLVRDRAGVSETVQVVAYATAPMALAGVGVPPSLCAATGTGGAITCTGLGTVVAGLRVLLACWGAGLLVYGLAVVHETSLVRAAVAAALPALLVFGYLFGGVFALESLLGVELVSRPAEATPGGAAPGRARMADAAPAHATSADMARQIPERRILPPP